MLIKIFHTLGIAKAKMIKLKSSICPLCDDYYYYCYCYYYYYYCYYYYCCCCCYYYCYYIIIIIIFVIVIIIIIIIGERAKRASNSKMYSMEILNTWYVVVLNTSSFWIRRRLNARAHSRTSLARPTNAKRAFSSYYH